jgi:hypothetical protein
LNSPGKGDVTAAVGKAQDLENSDLQLKGKSIERDGGRRLSGRNRE